MLCEWFVICLQKQKTSSYHVAKVTIKDEREIAIAIC